MGLIDPLGRPVIAQFPDGSVATSKYQGWCEKHGKVWLYDAATKKPKVNGVCGECWRAEKAGTHMACTIHGIVLRGKGGRCAECEARGYPPVEDNLPPLDEIDDDAGGGLSQDGLELRGDVDPNQVP